MEDFGFAVVTVSRPDQDLTVALTLQESWVVQEALDEAGDQVCLTPQEVAQALALVLAGRDEAGY
jgi:hypothetical protein